MTTGIPLHVDMLNDHEPVTSRILDLWAVAMQDILINAKSGITNIEPVVANRYAYDFYGLLLFLGIDPIYHYPYMLANGYLSPTQFLGDKYVLTHLNLSILSRYYLAFTR